MVNDVEVMVEGAVLDGMVFLSSCDKTTPAHLMAAARLNLPSLVIPCGYQLGGNCGGRDVDIEEVYKGVGTAATGKMSMNDLEDWTRVAIKGPGVCAGLATANSMHVMAEALGMALPGTTPIRAASDRLFEIAGSSGNTIMDLITANILPRAILTPAAIRNAVRVAVALGVSVNVVRHLSAVASEAELDPDVVALFEGIGVKKFAKSPKLSPMARIGLKIWTPPAVLSQYLWQLRQLLETDVLHSFRIARSGRFCRSR